MADEDDNSTSLLSKSEEDTGEPNYAIFGQDGPNLGKYAQPTMIGNVSLIIIMYVYNQNPQ